MATWLSTASRAASLLTVVAVVGSLNACTPKPNGPEPAAEKFFAALATGDTVAASELSDRPADATAALQNAGYAVVGVQGSPALPVQSTSPAGGTPTPRGTGITLVTQ